MVSRSSTKSKSSSTSAAKKETAASRKGAVAKKIGSKSVQKATVEKTSKVVKSTQKTSSTQVVKKTVAKKVVKAPLKKIESKPIQSGSKSTLKGSVSATKKSNEIETKKIKKNGSAAPTKAVLAQPVVKKPVASKKKIQSSTLSPTKDTRLLAHAVASDASPSIRVAKAIVKDNVTVSPTPSPAQLITIAVAPNLLEEDDSGNPGILSSQEVFDETDRAQHMQLLEQAEISRRAREMNRPQTHPDFDGLHCLVCDVEIPAKRLEAGRIRCVDCQEEADEEARRSAFYNKARGLA